MNDWWTCSAELYFWSAVPTGPQVLTAVPTGQQVLKQLLGISHWWEQHPLIIGLAAQKYHPAHQRRRQQQQWLLLGKKKRPTNEKWLLSPSQTNPENVYL